MEFKHFLGNEKIKAQLSALVDGGRLPHAVVLEGESGLGKRTLPVNCCGIGVPGEHRLATAAPVHKARAGCTGYFGLCPGGGAVRSIKRRWIKLWAMCI